MSRQQERQQHHDRNRRAQTESTQASAAISRAMQDETTTKNPAFVDEIASLDLNDSRLYDWLEDELGPTINNQHALGNRDEEWTFRQMLLNRNLIERYIAERTPGRQLRQHPKLHALAQGVRGWEKGNGPESDNPPTDYRKPIGDRRRRVLREAAKAVTSHQSLAEGGEGLKTVGTVRTEARTVQADETKESGITSRVNGALFG